MSLRKRGDAWQVTVCWRGQVYRSQSRRWNREQAAEVEKKILDDLHAISVGRQPARTLQEGLERYEADELPRMKERTRQEAKKNIAHIKPFIEGRYLTEGEEVAAEIRRAFQSLSPSTSNRRVQVVARILSLAYHPWKWLDKPIRIPMLPEKHRDRFLTKAEVEKLAKSAGGANGDFIRLLAYTGIRKSQALALTKAQVRGGFIHLDRSGKSGKPQLVPVHPSIRHIIRRIPLPVTLGTLNKSWYRAIAETGIKARIHDLRHSLASWMIQTGSSLTHVQEMLGHHSVAVTQRYAHLTARHLRKAVGRI